jgi:glycine dehydrogenase subunit 1
MRYIPHTKDDVARMLGVIGKPSVASLFEHIPARLRATRPLDIEPLAEQPLLAHLGELAMRSQPAVGATARDGAALSFLGAGLTPHHIPVAVDMLLQRSEWYTSYTPYQPEISQGTLQAIFEFQTIVSELLGLGLANASMYDGATAAAEALMMAERVTGRHRSLLSRGLHPHYADTIYTYLRSEHGHVANSFAPFIDFGKDGRVDQASLGKALAANDIGCVVVQSPNFFGVVEDLNALSALAHAHGALLVVATAEPLAYGVLASPGSCGADIAVGEGIGLAVPPQMGGPGVGLFAARPEMVRQLPGRLCGETVDKDGRRGYVLTLATREQHIRREKATSNICTNQGLIALAFTIHLSLLGKRGYTELARLNLAKAEYAKSLLIKVPGVSLAFSGPTFNELSLRLPRKASDVVAKLAERGVYAGVSARGAGLYGVPPEGMTAVDENVLVVAVTELHTRADIHRYAGLLEEVLR